MAVYITLPGELCPQYFTPARPWGGVKEDKEVLAALITPCGVRVVGAVAEDWASRDPCDGNKMVVVPAVGLDGVVLCC